MYIKFSFALDTQNGPALKATITKVNESIEYMSKLLHFAILKVTIAGVEIPALLATIINYFVYDLEDDSYLLPFPIM